MKANRITVGREALAPALGLVCKAVEKRNTIPILANLKIEADADQLTLTGTDLDREVSVTLPCKASAALATTLPSALLHDAVRKLAEGVEIAIEVDDKVATVKAARSIFRMPVLPVADFPTLTAGDFTHRFDIDAPLLESMIDTVGFAISSEETRYYLNGIHWHVDEDRLVAVTTDGHRLSRLLLPLPAGAEGMPAIILPRTSIGLLKALLGKGSVSVALSESKVRFETAQGALLSKLIDGTFPDYKRVIPTGNGNHFTVGREALAKAVDRVTTISSGKGSAVTFSFTATELTLHTMNPDSGSADDILAVDHAEGEDVVIGFNGRYCLDMLGATDAEQVVFSLGDPGAPALIRPKRDEDDGTLFVMMPMRI